MKLKPVAFRITSTKLNGLHEKFQYHIRMGEGKTRGPPHLKSGSTNYELVNVRTFRFNWLPTRQALIS